MNQRKDRLSRRTSISFKCNAILIGLLLALAIAGPVLAQTPRPDDGTTLKQIIIFGRHSIRSSTVHPDVLATYSSNVYPPFAGVPVGYLTPNGQEAALLLGSYFHDYLLQEGLLTGSAAADLSRSHFRSNSISHVLRSMMQAISGKDLRGAFGDHRSRIVVVISSDSYMAGLAGLLGLHWTLPGYQTDYTSPGGSLVFEVRQSNKSKEYLVRAFYTSQTLDQLRNLTPLTLEAPPRPCNSWFRGAAIRPRIWMSSGPSSRNC